MLNRVIVTFIFNSKKIIWTKSDQPVFLRNFMEKQSVIITLYFVWNIYAVLHIIT